MAQRAWVHVPAIDLEDLDEDNSTETKQRVVSTTLCANWVDPPRVLIDLDADEEKGDDGDGSACCRRPASSWPVALARASAGPDCAHSVGVLDLDKVEGLEIAPAEADLASSPARQPRRDKARRWPNQSTASIKAGGGVVALLAHGPSGGGGKLGKNYPVWMQRRALKLPRRRDIRLRPEHGGHIFENFRTGLLDVLMQRVRVRGRVIKPGHPQNTRKRRRGKKRHPVLLRNVKVVKCLDSNAEMAALLEDGRPMGTDHVWLHYSKQFESLMLSRGDMVEFEARVRWYRKNGGWDLRLSHHTHLTKVEGPKWNKLSKRRRKRKRSIALSAVEENGIAGI